MFFARLTFTTLLVLVSLAQPASGQGPVKVLEKGPAITTAGGKVGDLLRTWWKEGKAAGLEGVTYDNRDGGHSDLNLKLFPQVTRHVYSKEDIQARRHWAAQRKLMPGIVLGNSSTSAPPLGGGSNPRIYYVSPMGLAFLHLQYRKNNLYVYPEHRDHDPGHNGPSEGFGDLYPTNTPYLLISQGSSGSDQAFLRAAASTLAAFRPDTRKKLADLGLLMPTVQMILRRSYKPVRTEADYFTGAAHPTVFEGNQLDELAMVQRAQTLDSDDLPPLVQLRVVEEDVARQFRDYSDLVPGEKLADTPQTIARIWRGHAFTRRMVVSAEGSFDPEKKPLKFAWKLLRGDPSGVRITPKGKDGSSAEIVVEYRPRRPIAPGSPLESTRVDIGVFALDGTHLSAPGFVTWFMLDDEARTYDDKGRLLELGHGQGTVRMEVLDWPAWFAAAGKDEARARILGIAASVRERFRQAAEAIAPLHRTVVVMEQELRQAAEGKQQAAASVQAAEKKTQQAGKETQTPEGKQARQQLEAARATWQTADGKHRAIQKNLQGAQKAERDYLDAGPKGGGESLRRLTDKILSEAITRPEWFAEHRQAILELLAKGSPTHRKELDQGKNRLEALGIAAKDGTMRSIRTTPAGANWTDFEQTQIAHWNGTRLEQFVFPKVLAVRYRVNTVDPRLATSRDWRDVFHYWEDDTLLGWTRHDREGTFEFDFRGRLVSKKDASGRPTETQEVIYSLNLGQVLNGQKQYRLRFAPGKTRHRIEYSGPQDRLGRVVEIPAGKKP